MHVFVLLVSLGAILISSACSMTIHRPGTIIVPGPRYPPTKGEIWPKPRYQDKSKEYYTFKPENFTFTITSYNCDILTRAIDRYDDIFTKMQNLVSRYRDHAGCRKTMLGVCPLKSSKHDSKKGLIRKLKITLTKPCETYPHSEMDEAYNLTVMRKSELTANSIWGVLHGLESFSQMFYFTDDYSEVRINATRIEDSPRYEHRGLLLDTSRHYISITNIMKTLDAMAYNKMNVFHWHIVDDESFPFVSETYPELSLGGAYHQSAIYRKDDVKGIIDYARDRGIRVLPEFDVPGHTRSWGVSHPEILTKCYARDKVIGLGPLNPVTDVTYDFLKEFFKEVKETFPEQYLHIGGDEVDFDCWESNPEIKEYMAQHNLTTISKIHTLFMNNVLPLLNSHTKTIVWQEVFDEKVNINEDTLIQVWKVGASYRKMNKILAAGYKVVFSSLWYLDRFTNVEGWEEYYMADPRENVHNETLEANVVGGEACMWAEMVDNHNVLQRVWPRAGAIAERLWSPAGRVPNEVIHRLEEHTCRLIRRGIPAQPPSGPGFCLVI